MTDSKEIYRPHTFMTANMNGWEAEERELRQSQGGTDRRQTGGMAGPKVLRWHRLRTLLTTNSVDVLAVQKHHYKQQEGKANSRRRRGWRRGHRSSNEFTGSQRLHWLILRTRGCRPSGGRTSSNWWPSMKWSKGCWLRYCRMTMGCNGQW